MNKNMNFLGANYFYCHIFQMEKRKTDNWLNQISFQISSFHAPYYKNFKKILLYSNVFSTFCVDFFKFSSSYKVPNFYPSLEAAAV